MDSSISYRCVYASSDSRPHNCQCILGGLLREALIIYVTDISSSNQGRMGGATPVATIMPYTRPGHNTTPASNPTHHLWYAVLEENVVIMRLKRHGSYSSNKGTPMVTILIVDDERDTRDVLDMVLRREEHEVISIGSGESALDHLNAHEVDLVLSDVVPPCSSPMKVERERRRSRVWSAASVLGQNSRL